MQVSALVPWLRVAAAAAVLTSAGDPEPFPAWLAALTNLTAWPAGPPPYIALADVDLASVPAVPPRVYGADCAAVPADACAFECGRCVAADDVATCPGERLVQTFDDGPTPATLDLLAMLRAPATFFVIGRNVVSHPRIFRMQRAEGHLLASHSWDHPYLPALSNEEIAAQLQWSIWAMNASAGVVPVFFRPPYGATDARVRAITRQFGLTTVLWDRDTDDWRLNNGARTQAQVVAAALAWQDARGGGIMLEHDSTAATVRAGLAIHRALAARNRGTLARCVARGGALYQSRAAGLRLNRLAGPARTTPWNETQS